MSAEKSSKKSHRELHVVRPDRSLLRIAVIGNPESGKADLLGCLFEYTAPLAADEATPLRAAFEKAGKENTLVNVLRDLEMHDDGVKQEGTVCFRSARRDYQIANERGDAAFIRSVMLGERSADAAILVVDLATGLDDAARRRADILRLLAIRQIAVVLYAQDSADLSQRRIDEVKSAIVDELNTGDGKGPQIVPVILRTGAMIAERGDDLQWYDGPTLIDVCDRFETLAGPGQLPFRMPVHESRRHNEGWQFCGRIEAGRVKVGDQLVFSPSNKTAVLKAIEISGAGSLDAAQDVASAGQSVGLTLVSSAFIEREEIASHVEIPPIETEVFGARVYWLADEPLVTGKRYRMKIGSNEANIKVETINKIINPDDMSSFEGTRVTRGEVAEIVLRARRVLAIDEYTTSPLTGSLTLLDGANVVCGGLIFMEGYADQRALSTQRATNITRVDSGVSSEARQEVNGHRGGVLWFTGLSGSGKSTLAVGLETRLHQRGYQTFVLDGDNVRMGLNANLGFSPEDRAENVRRVGEVAGLFSTAGMIVISAFISPYRSDRERARVAGRDSYHEIYIKADLATCEKRDPKGLYRKARAGEIADFTGISAPYEAPEQADLVIDTAARSIEDCLDELVAYVDEKFPL